MFLTLLASSESVPAPTASSDVDSIISFFNALFPDVTYAIYFLLFLIGGVSLGVVLKKIFRKLSMHESLLENGKILKHRKIFTRALFDTLAGTSIFLCSGLGVVAFREFMFSAAEMPGRVDDILARLFWIFIVCAQTVFLWHFIKLPVALIRRYSSPTNKSIATLLPLIEALMKLGVIVLGILILIRITTDTQPAEIVAMLGVGGLALGLAAQDSVKNFFGSAMLVLDEPFRVGDTVDIGDEQVGMVEKVGVRSTRIRAFDGSLLCVPNADLANRLVRTISARRSIREDFSLSLTYDTPPKKVEEALEILREIFSDARCRHDSSCPPRIYFDKFDDSALKIQVTYYFAGTDYSASRYFKEETNLKILGRFNTAGIEFAFPSQTIYRK